MTTHQSNVIYIVLAIATVFGLLVYHFYDQTRVLQSELIESQARYELIKSHIDAQAQAINTAHMQLRNYETKISEIELNYQLKLKGFENELAKVKTCDDGLKYLKKTLDELKSIKVQK